MDRIGASSSRAVVKNDNKPPICHVPSEFVECGSVLPSKVTLSSNKAEKKCKNKEESGKISGNGHGSTNSSLNVNKGYANKEKSFHIEMQEYHKYRLEFPKKFVMNNGKVKNGRVKLKNGKGGEWQVNVTGGPKRCTMSGGWLNFLVDNKVFVGSTLLFSASSSNTIDVQVVNEGPKRILFEHLENVQVPRRGHKKKVILTTNNAKVPKDFDLNIGIEWE